MKSPECGDDRFACLVSRLNCAGLTGTKIILWLGAITIACFVIGFLILAVSGSLPASSDTKASPFRHSSLLTPNTTAIPLDGATSGNLRLTLGAGELTLRGGAPPSTLLETTVFSKAPVWQPEIVQAVNGTVKSVAVIDKGSRGKEWFAVDSPNSWDIRVNDQVPVNLAVEVGAGDNHLDVKTLNLTSLTVNTGAGDTEVTLGSRPGLTRAEIHNGVGDLTLRVSRNSNTRITLHQGVGDISSSGFDGENGILMTKGFNPALPVTEIFVKQGVGDITLETE